MTDLIPPQAPAAPPQPAPAQANTPPWEQQATPPWEDNGPSATPGVLSKVADVADDIGAGVTEIPRAIVHGTGNFLNDTSNTLKSAGDYLNKNVADLGTVNYENGSLTWKRGTPDKNVLQTPNVDAPESTTGKFLSGVVQFSEGMAGWGKVTKLIGLGGDLAAAAKVAVTSGKAGLTNAFNFDSHAQNLSDVIENHPSLSNPVTRFLQSSPDDSEATARFKRGLEAAGLGTIVDSFVHGVAALKAAKAGDVPTAVAHADATDAALQQHSVAQAEAKAAAEVQPTPVAPEAPKETVDTPAGPAEQPVEAGATPATAPDAAEPAPHQAPANENPEAAPAPAEAPLASPAAGKPVVAPLSEDTLNEIRDFIGKNPDGDPALSDEGIHIPISSLRSDDGVKTLFNTLSIMHEDAINAVRGGDENGVQTFKAADAVSKQFETNPTAMLSTLRTLAPSFQNLAPLIRATGNMTSLMFKQGRTIAQMISEDRATLEKGGVYTNMDEARADFRRTMQLGSEFHGILIGGRTNIARALNFMKEGYEPRGDANATAEGSAVKPRVGIRTPRAGKGGEFGGVFDNTSPSRIYTMGDDELTKLIGRTAVADASPNASATTGRLVEMSRTGKAMNAINSVFANSLLSLKTLPVKALGDIFNGGIIQPVEQMLKGMVLTYQTAQPGTR